MKRIGIHIGVMIGLTLVLSFFWFIFLLFLSTITAFTIYFIFQLIFIVSIIINLVLFFKKKKKRLSKVFAIVLALTLSITFFLITLVNGASPYISKELYDKNIAQSPTGKVKLYKDVFAIAFLTSIDLSQFENKKVGNKTFYKKTQLTSKLINTVTDGIKKEEDDYRNIFGTLSKAPVSIIFYSNYRQMSSDNHLAGKHSGGYLPSKKRISIYTPPKRINDLEYIEKISAHEYSHFLLDQFTQKHSIPASHIPVWLNEGIAQYIQKKSEASALNEEALNGKKVIPFEKLTSIGGWNAYLAKGNDTYGQSALFVAYLVNKNGFNSLHRLILNLKGHSFEQAFKMAVGEEFDDYEHAFIEKIDRSLDLWTEANTYMKENNQKQLLVVLDNIHDLFPGNSEPIKIKAEIFMSQGEYQKAIQYGKNAEKINPHSIDINEFLTLSLVYESPKDALNEVNRFKTDFPYHNDLSQQLKILNEKINNGQPYQGYLNFIKIGYISNPRNKVDLINIVLKKYDKGNPDYKFALVNYKNKLSKGQFNQ